MVRPSIARVSSADDPRLAAFRLTERGLNPRSSRREATPPGMFVAEGDLVVERALAAGYEPVAVLAADPFAERIAGLMASHAPILVASEQVRREATGLGVALDVVGLFRRRPAPSVGEVVATARHIVVLDCVDNPTNVGAVVRSCAALGADALVLGATSADPLARRALRVSMGAAFSLATTRHDGSAAELLALLGDAGVTTVALTPAADAVDIRSLVGLRGPVALVLGSERSGLDDSALAACSHRSRIPMHAGIDSLNVAAAAAVAAFTLFTDWPDAAPSGQHRAP